MTLYQVCSSCHDLSKNMAVRGWGLISLYIYIRHFKNLFVRNHWTNFNITAELFLWWSSFTIQFKPSWWMKKTWPLGCRVIKFIQKFWSSKLGWNFNSKYAKLFAQVSDIGPSWSSCFFFFPSLDLACQLCLFLNLFCSKYSPPPPHTHTLGWGRQCW